jgi:hypothetical protein
LIHCPILARFDSLKLITNYLSARPIRELTFGSFVAHSSFHSLAGFGRAL